MSQNKRWEALVDFADQIRREKKVPGMVVGVLQEGQVQTAGFGVTNVDHPLPVTPGTLFQVGSITKTVTGTAVMRLVCDGKLELDAPIRTYLPDFKVADSVASAEATLRHLLIHTGGWPGDFFHDTGPGSDALPKYMAAMAELEQLAPLGAHFSYCNSGFVLAGYLIESVTGKSYQEAVRELVIAPLGLAQTYFDPGDVMVHRFAVGHYEENDVAAVAQPWPLPRYAYAAGGITCSAADLLEYAHFHLGDGTTKDGTRLLPAAVLADMHTPQVTVRGQESWGLTWHIDDSYGTRLLGHGGGTTGQVSGLMLAPEHKLALAVFTNSGSGGAAVEAVRRWVLQEYLDIDAARPAPRGATVDELAPFVGKYGRPFMDVELGILGGRLTAQVTYKRGFPTEDTPAPPSPPPASLDLCAPDQLIVLNGIMKDALVDVVRQPDGSVGWLRVGLRLNARQT